LDDRWAAGDAYEVFMGRWSRLLAERFVRWLDPGAGLAWLDVGCGTGALTSTICKLADPASVVACDPARPFVEHTRHNIPDPRVSAVHAGAGNLPSHPDGFDCVVSGLVFNFLPDPLLAVGEMRAGTRAGGTVAAYVWDYAEGMQFLRYFWDEAVALDEAAGAHDEGVRFPLCRRDALATHFRNGGLQEVRSEAIEISTVFESFSDYWTPFTQGTGPAPSYVSSLSEVSRKKLQDRLEHRLTSEPDGSIRLVARAWAVRGSVP